MATVFEPEDLIAMRAFPKAQELFEGTVSRALTGLQTVGWHDTAVSPWVGAFCVVRSFAGLDEYVGEILRFEYNRRAVYAYCREEADVPWSFSLSRRAFLGLAGLTKESIDALVGVI